MRAHRGFTVAEISIMAAISLILIIVVFGLIRHLRVQDGWTSNRLEGASGGSHAVDAIRYDATRARYRQSPEAPALGDGTLRFKVSGDSPAHLPAEVSYQVQKGTQYLGRVVTTPKQGTVPSGRRDEKVLSSSRFQRMSSKAASDQTSQAGLVHVEVEVGKENQIAGPRSRTTTAGIAVLLREQNLRARYPQWSDKGNWAGEEPKLPDSQN